MLNDVVMARCGLSEVEANHCFEQYFEDTIQRVQQIVLSRGEAKEEYSEHENVDSRDDFLAERYENP